jgi:hypothetical protein
VRIRLPPGFAVAGSRTPQGWKWQSPMSTEALVRVKARLVAGLSMRMAPALYELQLASLSQPTKVMPASPRQGFGTGPYQLPPWSAYATRMPGVAELRSVVLVEDELDEEEEEEDDELELDDEEEELEEDELEEDELEDDELEEDELDDELLDDELLEL